MYRIMNNQRLKTSIHGFLARKLDQYPDIRSEFPATEQKRGFLASKSIVHKNDNVYQPCLRPGEFILRNY